MWQFIVGFAIALVLTFALMPKPQRRPPAGLEDIDAPIAKEGVEIPVLFGCRDIRGANVVWYGDLKTKAIKAKGGKK